MFQFFALSGYILMTAIFDFFKIIWLSKLICVLFFDGIGVALFSTSLVYVFFLFLVSCFFTSIPCLKKHLICPNLDTWLWDFLDSRSIQQAKIRVPRPQVSLKLSQWKTNRDWRKKEQKKKEKRKKIKLISLLHPYNTFPCDLSWAIFY